MTQVTLIGTNTAKPLPMLKSYVRAAFCTWMYLYRGGQDVRER